VIVSRRTTFQVAFVIMGLIIWGYGQRVDDPTVRLVGIAFFAVAFLLRFFRSSDTKVRHDDEEDPVES
jgi:hypothetical protein